MSESQGLRSRSRSPIGRRSPSPSSSRYRASPRRSSRSPFRRRTLYRSENYDCSITEVDSDQTDATWAGIDDVLENADKIQAETEKNEEESNVATAPEKMVIKMNVIKKTEDKVVAADVDSVKKIMVWEICNQKESEDNPEFIKKTMPRPMVLDAEIEDNIKQETSDTETENPITQSPPKREVPKSDNAQKKLPSNPQFHIPVKKILRQMKPCLDEVEDLELKCKVIKVAKDRLITRIKSVLIGQPYLNNTTVRAFYRKSFPLGSDEKFVKRIVEDIGNGKCDHILLKDDEDNILLNSPRKRVVNPGTPDQEKRKQRSLGYFLLNLSETVQSMAYDRSQKRKRIRRFQSVKLEGLEE